MSNISDRHVFTPFVSTGSDKSKPLSGQRLCKVIFKSRNGNQAAMPSQCASVPIVSNDEIVSNVQSLLPFISDLVASTQDNIARTLLLAGADAVTSEQISLSACISHLVAESKGDRLTGDDISAWFTAELEPLLLVAFADKLGVSDSPSQDETDKLSRICNVYRDKLSSMAGGRAAFDPATITKLTKALQLADSDDVMASRLLAKLDAMSKVSVTEMLDL